MARGFATWVLFGAILFASAVVFHEQLVTLIHAVGQRIEGK